MKILTIILAGLLLLAATGCEKEEECIPKEIINKWPNGQGSPEVTLNEYGLVYSVYYDDVKKPVEFNVSEFIKTYLTTDANYEFRKEDINYGMKEFNLRAFSYAQFYKGVPVERAGFVFHYTADVINYAHGHFILVKNENAIPEITALQANEIFFKLNNGSLQGFELAHKTELLIREFKIKNGCYNTKLIYKIWGSKGSKPNADIGIIDAHTGKLLDTEPSSIF